MFISVSVSSQGQVEQLLTVETRTGLADATLHFSQLNMPRRYTFATANAPLQPEAE